MSVLEGELIRLEKNMHVFSLFFFDYFAGFQLIIVWTIRGATDWFCSVKFEEVMAL